jgi:hypothetical protein
MGFETKSLKRTAENVPPWHQSLSRPLRGLRFPAFLLPALKCWAITIRPLRGLNKLLPAHYLKLDSCSTT